MTERPVVILHTDAPQPALAALRELHPDLPIHTCETYAGLPGLMEQIAAEVIYTVRFDNRAFPRQALTESTTVKWISVGGSGTDHLRPWDSVHVTVTNAAGVAAGMMAEYTLGCMLSFSLNLRGFAKRQQAHEWSAGSVQPIEGQTLLILGLGKSGQAIARRAKAAGMITLGIRARPQPTRDVDEVHAPEDLPALWGRADFIVCCVPLLAGTRGLVGANAFAAMKPSAVLIDVSRGNVVDTVALMAALGDGRLKGAALDVFPIEPLPKDHPLWDYDNVIITPHCSSVYNGWDVKSVRMFAENLAQYRQGKPLANVVSPERGY